MGLPGLVVPVSGPYTGTYVALGPTAQPIGTLSDDGYEMRVTLPGQEIAETDAWGLTLVEAITRGQNWRLLLRGLEWTAALIGMVKMFGTTGLLSDGLLTPSLNTPRTVGDRWTKYANTLTLTAILGNPPTTPSSLTALNAAFAPNTTSAFLMTSKMRELPIEMVLFPYQTVITSTTVIVPFTSIL